jgi:CBS domain-containing protein
MQISLFLIITDISASWKKQLPHLYFKVHDTIDFDDIVPYYNVILKRSGIGPHSRDRSEGDAMLKAKDIMTSDVISVSTSTTVEEFARILVERRISGAPVIDDQGSLIGIVTENDLIRKNKKFHIPTIVRLFDAYIMLESKSRIEQEIKEMAAVTVDDIYRKGVVTIGEDTPVDEIATIMSEKAVHLIPVVEGKKIKGIIGKIDIIKGLSLGNA